MKKCLLHESKCQKYYIYTDKFKYNVKKAMSVEQISYSFVEEKQISLDSNQSDCVCSSQAICSIQ